MKKVVCALLISAAAVSAPAFAEGFMDGVVGSKYIAADVGQISYPPGNATSIDVGFGYQVHPAVAVEVDYLNGSKYSYNVFGVNADYQLTALQVAAVGHYNFGNGWGAYAKAGIAHNMQKATGSLFGISISQTATSNDLMVAIGGTYDVADNIKVRAQYQETGISSVNVLSIGAQFGF
ncbi:MAG TPA: outer membrane beta-barrel protein [Gallionellaceae bacterium]|nr:outer membrane beta-barrel protein [Gallionellaceae bacterium]